MLGAVRYELIVWWDPLSAWQPLGGDGLTNTSYTHTGVTAGREYYYTVRAVDAAGKKSGWQQNFASATVPTASATPTATPTSGTPSQPTPTPTATSTPTPASSLTAPALTAAAVENAIELRWDAVPGAVRYELMVWWDPLPAWQPLDVDNLTGTIYTHTDVTAGREYYYTVRAVDAAGKKSGWQQNFASATVPVASATPTPTSTPTPAAE